MIADQQTFRDIFTRLQSEDQFSKWDFDTTTASTRRMSKGTHPSLGLVAFTGAHRSEHIEWGANEPISSKSGDSMLGTKPEIEIPTNAPVIVRTAATGSVVFCMSFANTADTDFIAQDGKKYTGPWLESYDPDYYRVPPNSFGPPPDLKDWQVIPPNSPRVCVGWGSIALKGFTNGWVIHDQYWAVQSSSYSLVPRQKRRTLVELVTGLQDTTSDTKTVEASLGVSLSGGWGPVSAAINASLSMSTTHEHTVSLTQQTTTTSEDTVQSASDKPIQVVYWGLVDSYALTGIDKEDHEKTVAIIESVQAPPVVRTYPPDAPFATPPVKHRPSV